MKFGMTKAWGGAGSATSRLIMGAETPFEFGGGLCASTWSAGAVGDGTSATALTSSPRRPNVHLGSSFALPEYIRNLHALRTQARRHANLPAPAHQGSERRQLREDFSFRHLGAVVFALNHQLQAALLGDSAGLGRSLANQVGHGDLATMDHEAHGGERGDQRNHQKHQREQQQPEKGFHETKRL